MIPLQKVKDIIEKHKHMGINQDLVATWKDCLIETIAQFDCEFNSELQVIWSKSLTNFTTGFMKQINNQ